MKKLILFLVVFNLITFGQTAEEYNDKGIAKYNLKDYTGAIADFNKTIQLNPDYVVAYFNRGFAKHSLKDYTGAISDYNKTIQLNPDYADAYYYRGNAKTYLNDWAGAIADYNKAIQLKPDFANAYNSRGDAKISLKDWTACKDWTKARELGFSVALTAEQKNLCKAVDELKMAEEMERSLQVAFADKVTVIKIGTQTWTSKNLDVSTYRNGDNIPEVQDFKEWKNLTTGAWCYYENKTANGAKYGKLYNWYAVSDPRGLAPTGYHIPSDDEWRILTNYLGDKAGTKMKSTSGWSSYSSGGSSEKTCPNCANWSELYRKQVPCHTCRGTKLVPAYEPKKTNSGNGSNSSGINGLAGGCLWTVFGFTQIGSYGEWWSSSEWTKYNFDEAWHYNLVFNNNYVVRSNNFGKQNGYSVRCIKD